MMNRPSNWDEVQGKDAGDFERLPPGAYRCRITNAEVALTQKEGKQMLVLQLEIAGGEYADFFANSQYPPKYYQMTGLDDGNKKMQSYFKGMITAIEQSNEGYSWDWNPASLIHKRVAVAFGEEDREHNGKIYTDTKPKFVRSLQALRDGKIETPKPKKLNGGGNSGAAGSNHAPQGHMPAPSGLALDVEEDDDLPF